MIKQSILDNTLAIRRFLNENGGIGSTREIKDALGMEDNDLNRAIGWLAKEQCIFITRSGDDLIITMEFD